MVELCCGSGKSARALLDAQPDFRAVAHNASDTMLNRTRQTAGSYVDHFTTKRFLPASEDWRVIAQPGGVFVVADVVKTTTDAGRRLLARQWDEEVERNSKDLDRFRELGWNYHELTEPDPVDQPSTLVDQLDPMRDAGFVHADLHWAVAGHAIFSGARPEDS